MYIMFAGSLPLIERQYCIWIMCDAFFMECIL